jgi:serine/threonine-protein kinase
VDRPPGTTARRIFEAALEQPAPDRAAFLERACAGDAELRAEVGSLLDADRRAAEFLEVPPQVAAAEEPAGPDPMIGRAIGAWRIERRIGHGGMGNVYLARRADGDFGGEAAIKVIRRGMDSEEILERFRHERRVLARLQHPNIARLYDGGSLEDGLPYFVMELVDGEPLDRFCERRRLGVRERIAAFLTVCDAVQFAHQALIVHRDLKPANILATADGQIRLLDFGIAKLLAGDDSGTPSLTRAGRGPYTPRYASPEQSRGERVTTASDVYSLGVVLGDLLAGTGRPDPDLEAIVGVATRAEPERRYPTARELADDLRRWLDRRPVAARRGAVSYLVGKFVRRNALAVGATALVALSLLAGAAVSTALYLRARAARVDAEREREVADEVSRFLEGVFAEASPHRSGGGDVGALRAVLDAAARRVERGIAPGGRVAGALDLSLGATYRHLAQFEPAERHLRRAVAAFEADSTADPVRRARARLELGSLLLDTSRYPEAEVELSAAQALAGRAGARAGETRIEAAHAFGLLEEARGRSAEAEARYREALAATRAHYGAGDLRVAARMSDLAVLLMNHQRRGEADTLLAAAIGMWRAGAGPVDSVAFATGLHNLAGLRRRQSKFDEAAALYAEALAIYRRIHGSEHPDVARTLTTLGGNEEFAGRHAAAEPLYREALAMQRRLLGDRHRDVGTTLNNLGGLLRRMGRYEEADRTFREAARVYRAALGDDHPWLAILLTNHAAALEGMRDWTRLGATLDEAAPMARRHFPPGHWQHQILASLRGAWLAANGRREEAEPILAASHRALADSLGPDNAHVRDAERRLRSLRALR